MLAQYIVSGISTGMLYSLTALGLSLVYKTTGLINFAHGEMAMFTTFISYVLLKSMNVPMVWSFIIAVIAAFLLGVLVELVIFRKGAKLTYLSKLILTISLYSVFRGLASVIWGYTPRNYPRVINTGNYRIGPAVIDSNSIFIICLTLVLMLAMYLFFKTRTGLAMRAVAVNRTAAHLMGIKVNTINAYTWGIACLMGGVAGLLIAPTTFVAPTMMAEMLTKAFCAAVLGGFLSMPGVVIGGLLIGIIENLIGGYITSELKTSCIFLLLIVMLSIKPSGLLGKKEVKKV